jgi:hypothetical protein
MVDKKQEEVKSLNIYQRLAAVMNDVEYVQKEDKKVNNQYTFVSHDAVTKKIRQAFVKHGIVSVPRVIRHVQDGNRTEVDIEVDFVNIDNPDEKVVVPCFGYGIDPQDKGPGKAVSYAVKYAYLKVFALETGDDPERDLIEHDISEQELADKLAWIDESVDINELKDRFSELYVGVRKKYPKSNALNRIKQCYDRKKEELEKQYETV